MSDWPVGWIEMTLTAESSEPQKWPVRCRRSGGNPFINDFSLDVKTVV